MGWTDLASRKKQQTYILILFSQFLKQLLSFTNVWCVENSFRNNVFDTLGYFINFDVNNEFGKNSWLRLFDVLQKTADGPLKMAEKRSETRQSKR